MRQQSSRRQLSCPLFLLASLRLSPPSRLFSPRTAGTRPFSPPPAFVLSPLPPPRGASLASRRARARSAIRLPPTNYPLLDALPTNLVAGGLLSKLQLEGVLYACAKHCEWLPDGVSRAGFFIGDGAGSARSFSSAKRARARCG